MANLNEWWVKFAIAMPARAKNPKPVRELEVSVAKNELLLSTAAPAPALKNTISAGQY